MPAIDLSLDIEESFAQTLLMSYVLVDIGFGVDPELYIGGTLVNDKYMQGSGRLELQLNGRGTGGFVLTNPTKDYRPDMGATIRFTNNKVTLFAGVLNRMREYYEQAANPIRRFNCDVVDYGGALDRRTITAHLKNPGLALATIVTNLLFQNQIKPGPGSNATDINQVIFTPGVTPVIPGEPRHTLEAANMVMNRYADASEGYSYFIDENRNMLWRDHAAAPLAAPWQITDDSAGRKSFQSIEIDRDLSQYYNRVWVRTSLSIAQTYVDTFTGDDSTKIFRLRSSPSQILSIVVDGVEETFGPLEEKQGLDDDCIATLPQTFKQWYYFPIASRCLGFGSPLVEQHDSEAPVGTGLDIVITYKGPVSNFAFAEDTAEQAARAAEEGGTGIYEGVFDGKNIASEEMAQTLADALLAKHNVIPLKLAIRTQRNGLRPGHTISINYPDANINADFLIQRVGIDFSLNKRIQYDVEAVSTPLPIPRPEQFVEKLVEMARLGSDPLTTATAGDGNATGGGASTIATFLFPGTTADPETPITGDDLTYRYPLLPGVGNYYVPVLAFAFVTDAPVTDAVQVDCRYIDPDGVDRGSIFATAPVSIATSTNGTTVTDFSAFGLVLEHGGHLEADCDQTDAAAKRLGLAVVLEAR